MPRGYVPAEVTAGQTFNLKVYLDNTNDFTITRAKLVPKDENCEYRTDDQKDGIHGFLCTDGNCNTGPSLVTYDAKYIEWFGIRVDKSGDYNLCYCVGGVTKWGMKCGEPGTYILVDPMPDATGQTPKYLHVNPPTKSVEWLAADSSKLAGGTAVRNIGNFKVKLHLPANAKSDSGNFRLHFVQAGSSCDGSPSKLFRGGAATGTYGPWAAPAGTAHSMIRIEIALTVYFGNHSKKHSSKIANAAETSYPCNFSKDVLLSCVPSTNLKFHSDFNCIFQARRRMPAP